MFTKYKQNLIVVLLLTAFLASGCQQQANLPKPTVSPASSLSDIPAQRLGFRFEADVPAPPNAGETLQTDEKLPAFQTQFDQNRPTDTLVRTVASPDRQRVLAVYQRVTDEKQEFRLDLYDAGGKLLRKITPEGLALVFPVSVAWSPDGNNIAFVAMRRMSAPADQEIVQEAPIPPDLDETEETDANINATASPETTPSATPQVAPTLPIEAFRTEQIYLANREGGDLQALTQNEGLIYFYFIWSPDSSVLAALACKESEWTIRPAEFRRAGRPRLIEKTKRERLLDDNLTDVFPVFSPDSVKVATAYGANIRVYDVSGNPPTAAAIPLQNQLLTASIAFEQKQKQATQPVQQTENANTPQLPSNQQPPASYNPIVALRWAEAETLYLQTGFVRDYPGGESIRSFMRWHRLNLTPQAAALK